MDIDPPMTHICVASIFAAGAFVLLISFSCLAYSGDVVWRAEEFSCLCSGPCVCRRPCVSTHSDSFKAHWRQCFVSLWDM